MERPGGTRWSSPATSTLNRGKEKLTVDLRTEHGRNLLLDLIGTVDVLVSFVHATVNS